MLNYITQQQEHLHDPPLHAQPHSPHLGEELPPPPPPLLPLELELLLRSTFCINTIKLRRRKCRETYIKEGTVHYVEGLG